MYSETLSAAQPVAMPRLRHSLGPVFTYVYARSRTFFPRTRRSPLDVMADVWNILPGALSPHGSHISTAVPLDFARARASAATFLSTTAHWSAWASAGASRAAVRATRNVRIGNPPGCQYAGGQ